MRFRAGSLPSCLPLGVFPPPSRSPSSSPAASPPDQARPNRPVCASMGKRGTGLARRKGHMGSHPRKDEFSAAPASETPSNASKGGRWSVSGKQQRVSRRRSTSLLSCVAPVFDPPRLHAAGVLEPYDLLMLSRLPTGCSAWVGMSLTPSTCPSDGVRRVNLITAQGHSFSVSRKTYKTIHSHFFSSFDLSLFTHTTLPPLTRKPKASASARTRSNASSSKSPPWGPASPSWPRTGTVSFARWRTS